MLYFFQTLPKSIADSFRGGRIYFYLAAIVLTALIVLSGFDWQYFLTTRGNLLRVFAFPADLFGGVLPFLIPLYLVISGAVTWDKVKSALGWALAQAALAGWLVSSFLKALTGRIQPPASIAIDTARQFNFGFFREGIFWGWPSSHTTVAFAMAFALISLYPHSRKVKWLALIYALYIGIGVSMTIHWFSEFIAGALIGTAIGLAVGETYKTKKR